jgi:hypothetical protein
MCAPARYGGPKLVNPDTKDQALMGIIGMLSTQLGEINELLWDFTRMAREAANGD